MLTRREAFATFEVEVLHFVGGLGSNRAERVAVSRRPVEPDLDNASAGTVHRQWEAAPANTGAAFFVSFVASTQGDD